MGSWNTYTDNLTESKVDLCGIHGTNGAPWAQVAKFKCAPEEVAVLVQAIVNNDMGIYGTGACLAGKRWTVIRLEPEVSLMILKGKGPDNQKQTLVVAVSTQAVVIGANSDDQVQGPAVRTAVERIRDYLKQCGY